MADLGTIGTAGLLVALLVAPVAAQGGDAGARAVRDAVPDSRLVESSQVEVVEAWPFVVRARKKSDEAYCRGLTREAIRVTENGKALRVLSVSAAPPLVSHVLLMDTSSSMTDPNRAISRRRSKQARSAAHAYVNWMPRTGVGDAPRELMLFTSDDDFLMRVGPTSVDTDAARAAVAESIDAIGGGYSTLLNDSVYRLFDFLQGRDERSVVILLSDGMDSGSRKTAENVARLTLDTNDVTLFAIGIGLARQGYAEFEQFLETLSRSTGGRYFRVRGSPDDLGARIDGRFDEIHARLRSQLYVSWLTPNQGAKGAGSVQVRIESLDRRCRVPGDGYRPTRALRRADTEEATTIEIESDATDLADETKRLALTIPDALFDPSPRVGYPGERLVRQVVQRVALIEVPPFAMAHAAAPQPEASIHRWLTEGRLPLREVPGSVPTSREEEYPLDGEVNGKTFLDWRNALAQAVAETRPAFGDWARDRAARRIRRRLERLLEAPLDPEDLERFRRRLDLIVEDRVERLGALAYRDDLAAWHGDVSARELADRIERYAANLLLSGGAEGQRVVDLSQSAWVRLYDWLRVPDRVRVTTPLTLTCRGTDGPCGYYRIVLPRMAELPEDLTRPTGKTIEPPSFAQYVEYERIRVPRRPFALMTVRWLLGLPIEPGAAAVPADDPGRAALAATLRERWRVARVHHAPEDSGPIDVQAPRCRRSVTLDLLRPSNAGPQRARVVLGVEARLEPAEAVSQIPDACEVLPGPTRLTLRCLAEAPSTAAEIERGLQAVGIDRCPVP